MRLVIVGASTRSFVRYKFDGSWGWLDSMPIKRDIEIVSGDITDRDNMHRAVARCEVVIHLAALIGIPYSY
jgi:dTDP-glucose 4,6-dehydratase